MKELRGCAKKAHWLKQDMGNGVSMDEGIKNIQKNAFLKGAAFGYQKRVSEEVATSWLAKLFQRKNR